jgi:hypothetical protein
MGLKNIRHGKIKRVEVYYEWIQKLVCGLQTPTINNFLITMFQTRLQSYMRIATTRMMQTMLQHKEVTLLCKEGMTPTKAQSALLVPHIKNYNNTKTTYGTKKY